MGILKFRKTSQRKTACKAPAAALCKAALGRSPSQRMMQLYEVTRAKAVRIHMRSSHAFVPRAVIRRAPRQRPVLDLKLCAPVRTYFRRGNDRRRALSRLCVHSISRRATFQTSGAQLTRIPSHADVQNVKRPCKRASRPCAFPVHATQNREKAMRTRIPSFAHPRRTGMRSTVLRFSTFVLRGSLR